MRHLSPVAPCTLAARRRVQLLGGVTVSAVVLSAVLTANPAFALGANGEIQTKAELSSAFGNGSSSAPIVLGSSLTTTSDDYDSPVVPVDADVTLDLAGNTLDLDQIQLLSGSSLTIENTGTGGGLSIGTRTDIDSITQTGIKLSTDAALLIDGVDVFSDGSAKLPGIGTRAGATGARVTISGDSHVTAAGGSGAAGIGGGSSASGIAVSVKDTARVVATNGVAAEGSSAASGPSAIGAGQGGTGFGSLSVGSGSTVTVPTGAVLRVPATSGSSAQVVNGGTIAVKGSLTGTGTVQNDGSIVPSGAGTVGADLKVTNHSYLLKYSASDATVPSDVHVYAASIGDAQVAKSPLAAPTDIAKGKLFQQWEASEGGVLVAVTSVVQLSGLAASDGTIALTARFHDAISASMVTLSPANTNEGYSATVAATGSDITSYAVTTGSLPAGLHLDPRSGAITGTATSAGDAAFTITVTSTWDTTTADYTISVGDRPKVKASTLAAAVEGSAYSGSVATTEAGFGTGARTYSTTDSLPAGLALNADGSITGTPTAHVAKSYTFAVTAISAKFGTSTTPVDFTIATHTIPKFDGGVLRSVPLSAYYSDAVHAEADSAITYSLAPDSAPLPDGLTLSASGTISGTATDAGPYKIKVAAKAQKGAAVEQLYTLAVGAVPVILTQATLPDFTAGEAYSQQLAASGEGAVFTSADLPAGFALSPSGLLTSTLKTKGTATFSVKAVTSYGTAKQTFTVRAYQGPVLPDVDLVVGTVGAKYKNSVAVTAGEGVTTYSVKAGTALPAGLTLDPTTGVIAGTPSAKALDTSVTVVATATYGTTSGAAEQKYALRIGGLPVFTTASTGKPIVGNTYTQQVTAKGDAAVSYSLVEGTPAEFSISASGELTWTKAGGSPVTVTVLAHTVYGDAKQAIVLTPGSLPSFSYSDEDEEVAPSTLYTGQRISIVPIQQTGADSWVLDGELPDGLEFDEKTGDISGTATQPGPLGFSITAKNAWGPSEPQFVFRRIVTGPSISTLSLPKAVKGTPYKASLGFADESAVTVDGLPDGLTYDTDSNTISGTPTETGDFDVTLKAYAVQPETTEPIWTAPWLGLDLEGLLTQQLISMKLPDFEWSGPINLPWLPVQPVSDVSPAPDSSPSATALEKESEPVPNPSSTLPDEELPLLPRVHATSVLSLHVVAAPAVITAALPGGTAGTAYSVPVVATGDAALRYSISEGALPDGLALDSTTGRISGTPTAAQDASFTVTATSEDGSAARKLRIVVAAAPIVSKAPTVTPAPAAPSAPATSAAPVVTAPPVPVLPVLGRATVKFGYDLAVSVAANSATRVGYSLAGGDLPKGISLNGDSGLISGTAAEEGTFTATVKATNAAGSSTTTVTIVVPKIEALVKAKPQAATLRNGTPVEFTIKGLKKGEAWTVKVDGKVKLRGEAKKAGDLAVSVPLPKTVRDKSHTVKVSGSRKVTDTAKRASTTFTVTTVSARKSLSLKVDGRAGSVTRLAAGEKVLVVLSDRTVVARGTADADGVFTFGLKSVPKGAHTLLVTGSTEKRSAKLKITLG